MIIIQCLFGIIWGSFSNLVATRIKNQESIIFPASHCDQCGNKLDWWTMIPILSFILLRGHCHYCFRRIDAKNFITELVAFLLPIIFPQLFNNIELSIIIWLLFLISCCDINTLLIPSWSLWLILIVSILIQINHNHFNPLLSFIIFGVYIIILIINHQIQMIGNGDIDLIFLMINFLGLYLTAKMIVVSSLSAIIWYYVFQYRQINRNKIPFVPFISIGFGLIYV